VATVQTINMLYRLLIITACVFVGGAAQAGQTSITLAGMNVTVWSQSAEEHSKQPVIIFSHGFHGCATQSRYLMDALASAGYLIFAPNHRDATCNGGSASWLGRPEIPFRNPSTWNQTSYRDRAEDVRRLVHAIESDTRFRRRADLSRLGFTGHSLGGYTVLGLAGAWPSWRVTGIKAVLALSPYSQPFILRHTLSGLSAPVMYQGGTRDFGVTPAVQKNAGAYDQSPQPKYYVEFNKAGHFAWADIGITAHKEIVAYSLAFMNHYVKGEPAAPLLTKPTPGFAVARYASAIGNDQRHQPLH
jgi:predicted dienelactone hydrolase